MSKQRIRDLEEEILHHRDLYYNGEAAISDAAYDALEDELRRLDPDNSVLEGVGASPQGGWLKADHDFLMGSLLKARDPSELREWATSIGAESGLSWSEKLDGISLALNYEKGDLHSAVTRGDGVRGEDIMANAVLFRGVPRSLDRPFTGTIRGEVVLPVDAWRNRLSGYSNPRNGASGIARVEDRSEASAKCPLLAFYAYEILAEDPPHTTERQKYLILDDMGFDTPCHGFDFDLEEVVELRDRYESEMRAHLAYEIDGIVIRLSSREAFANAGFTNQRPRAAVAYKFPNQGAVSTLRDVTWEVGNTGRITPVAHFDPVDLVGATVRRASLYNWGYVRDELELCEEDRILVERANDVIPRVEEVVEYQGGANLLRPTKCPVCSAEVEIDGAYLVCPSSECPAQSTGTLKRWVEALDLLDWGESILATLVEREMVSDPADLYGLSEEELAEVENSGGARLGEKRARLLIDRLQERSNPPLSAFLGGLSIPSLRERTAKRIVDAGFEDLNRILDMDEEDLRSVDGIGEAKARQISAGLENKKNLVERLRKAGVEPEAAAGPLDGLRFCLTGRMSRKRSEIKRMVRESGGSVGGVSSNLDYLVTNNPESSSSKAKKARELDVPFLTEDGLYEMVGA